MTPFQIYLAIAAAPVATMVTVLVGVLVNNSVMSAHIRRLDEKIDAKAEIMDAHLRRVEDMLLGKFAELDTRLTRIEGNLNMH